MKYKIYSYDKFNNIVVEQIREIIGFKNLNTLQSDEIAFVNYLDNIPMKTLKSIELCYNINVPKEIKIELYIKSNARKYVSFIFNWKRYMYILLEEYKTSSISPAYSQIRRLQNELASIVISAGYSDDYLQRKFGEDYVSIMIENKGNINV